MAKRNGGNPNLGWREATIAVLQISNKPMHYQEVANGLSSINRTEKVEIKIKLSEKLRRIF